MPGLAVAFVFFAVFFLAFFLAVFAAAAAGGSTAFGAGFSPPLSGDFAAVVLVARLAAFRFACLAARRPVSAPLAGAAGSVGGTDGVGEG